MRKLTVEMSRANERESQCCAMTEPSGHIVRTNLMKPVQLSELNERIGSCTDGPVKSADARYLRMVGCVKMSMMCLQVEHDAFPHALKFRTKNYNAIRKTLNVLVYMSCDSPCECGMVPNMRGFNLYPSEQQP